MGVGCARGGGGGGVTEALYISRTMPWSFSLSPKMIASLIGRIDITQHPGCERQLIAIKFLFLVINIGFLKEKDAGFHCKRRLPFVLPADCAFHIG